MVIGQVSRKAEMTSAKELLLLATWEYRDHTMTFCVPGYHPEDFAMLFTGTLAVR